MSVSTRTRHDTDKHVIAADIVGETHAFSYTAEQKETATQTKACSATCAETLVIVWTHNKSIISPV